MPTNPRKIIISLIILAVLQIVSVTAPYQESLLTDTTDPDNVIDVPKIHFSAGPGPEIILNSPHQNSTCRPNALINFSISDPDGIDTVVQKWTGEQNQTFYWPYDTNVPTIAGKQEIQITANDTLGNTRSKNFTFWVDTSPPVVNLLSPANNSIYESGLVVQFAIQDNYDLSPNNACWYNWDGGKNISLSEPFNVTIPYGNGEKLLNFFANDSVSYVKHVTFNVTVEDPDSKGPTIILLNPHNNTTGRSEEIIDFDIGDENGLDKVFYNWDNTQNQTFSTPYDIAFNNTDGDHILRVYANDTLGNQAYSDFNFYTDDTIPNITITNTYNNTYHKTGAEIAFEFADVSGISWGKYSWDNGAIQQLSTSMPIIQIPDGEGVHSLGLNVSDTAGNINSTIYNFTTDNTSPEILLSTPNEDSYLRNGSVIDFAVDDNYFLNTTEYTWEDEQYPAYLPLNSPFDLIVAEPDGFKNVTIRAIDKAGNVATREFQFVIDSIMPQIQLLDFSNNSITQSGVKVRLNTTDNYEMNSVNASWYNWDGGNNYSAAAEFYTWTPYGNGTHILNVFAKDEAGNVNATLYNFTIDDPDSKAPTVIVIQPPAKSSVQSTETIDLDIGDNNGLDDAWYNWDNTANTTLGSPYDVAVQGPDGLHSLYVYANDTLGNLIGYELNFTTDDTPPNFFLSNTINNSYHQNWDSIKVNCGDLSPISWIKYSWNGGENQTVFNESSITDVLSGDEKWHNLTIYASDEAGNKNSTEFSFYIDRSAPTITLNDPPNESCIKNDSVIDLSVYDNTFLDNVNYSWDDESPTILDSPYDLDVQLRNGYHNLTIRAVDISGNIASECYNFTVDTSHPSISLLNIENNTIQLPNRLVNLSIEDASGVDSVFYNWDGDNNNSIEDPYEVYTPMTGGTHNLYVFANDTMGNQITNRTYIFIVDTAAPQISLLSPANDTTHASGMIISFDITDDNALSPFNDSWYLWMSPREGGSLDPPYEVALPQGDGYHYLYMWANDSLGNIQQKLYRFTTSDAAPLIELDGALNYSIYQSGFQFSLSIEDADDIDSVCYRWNSSEFSVLDSPYDLQIPIGTGPQSLFVRANDTLGNENQTEYLFYADNEAPGIYLNNTQDGAYLNATFRIFFNVSDEYELDGLFYNWNGADNETFSEATRRYNISVPQSDGTHDLYFYANDTAGNLQSAQFIFTIDDTLPTIILDSPANESAVLPFSFINFSISDDNMLSGFNGSWYRWDYDLSQSLAFPHDLQAPDSSGSHTLYVFANDSVGNINSKTYNFTVDIQPPAISLNGIANNSAQYPGTVIDLIIEDPAGIDNVYYTWLSEGGGELTDPYDLIIPAENGEHQLEIYANDTVGNEIIKNYVFFTDDAAPIITLNSPANQSTQSSNTEIDLSITDLHLHEVTYCWDDGTNLTLNTPYDTYLPAGSGWHKLDVYANDTSGRATAKMYYFYTDDSTPVIYLTSPANNSAILNQSWIFLEIQNVDEAFYSWDGEPNSTLSAPYEIFVETNYGEHVLLVEAYSPTEIYSNKSFTFIVDDGPPVITLVSPSNNSYQKSHTTIDLSISDRTLHNVSYKWDDGANSTLHPSFDTYLPDTQGWHQLFVYANDTTGQGTSKTYWFYTDDTLPSISLLSPSNNSFIMNYSVIYFEIDHAEKVFYSWDGEPNSTLSEPYEIQVELSAGEHQLLVEARSETGVYNNITFNFTLDAAPPVFILHNPLQAEYSDGQLLGGNDLIEFNAYDDHHINDVWYNWDLNDNFTLGSPYQIALTAGGGLVGDEDGIHVLYIYGDDLAGNLNSTSYTFDLDLNAPSVSSMNLANRSSARQETDITFMFSDRSGIDTIKYKWDSSSFSILTAPFEVEIPENQGWHTLTINITDNANNSKTAMYEFYTDNSQPQISLNGIETGAEVNWDDVITVWVQDDFGIANVQFRWDDGEYSSNNYILTDATSIQIPIPKTEGQHSLRVIVTDEAGNAFNEDILFKVKKPPLDPFYIFLIVGGAVSTVGIGIYVTSKKISERSRESGLKKLEQVRSIRDPYEAKQMLMEIEKSFRHVPKDMIKDEREELRDHISEINETLTIQAKEIFNKMQREIANNAFSRAEHSIDEGLIITEILDNDELHGEFLAYRDKISVIERSQRAKKVQALVSTADQLLHDNKPDESMDKLNAALQTAEEYDLSELRDRIQNKLFLTEKYQKISRVFKISERIKLDDLASILSMDRPRLMEMLVDWNGVFTDFKIVGDEIVIENAEELTSFIDILDKQYDSWKDGDGDDAGKKN